jgi:hypothetical protein
MSKDGGPAFPLSTPAWHEEVNQRGYEVADFTMGISARDYFAAKAMQSIYAHFLTGVGPAKHWTDEGMAESAYKMADAMLSTRWADEE